ncbi:hypothetical protein JTB14_018287 [Gonioctena quinquepunctata]|nr:hypothetical protein JTB14_018287 [Gonioctena quinquepunctata]
MEANLTAPPRNHGKIHSIYLKSHWAMKEKYQEVMEELYIEIQNNQSIPPNSLPQMQLPIFSGSYEEWPTFSDLFTRVINQNQSISKAGKL